MKTSARIMLLLAGFLALLPVVHHHGPTSYEGEACEHGAGRAGSDHAERFCVLATLQKSTNVDAIPPAIPGPERLNEPTSVAFALEPRASQLPRNLSPRAPPAV